MCPSILFFPLSLSLFSLLSLSTLLSLLSLFYFFFSFPCAYLIIFYPLFLVRFFHRTFFFRYFLPPLSLTSLSDSLSYSIPPVFSLSLSSVCARFFFFFLFSHFSRLFRYLFLFAFFFFSWRSYCLLLLLWLLLCCFRSPRQLSAAPVRGGCDLTIHLIHIFPVL